MFPRKYVGGKKKNDGLFAYFEGSRMHIGWNHVPMTRLERTRFLNSRMLQKGRKIR
jgi:hypothetical protein